MNVIGARGRKQNVRARFSGKVTVSACKAGEIFAGSHYGRVREQEVVPDTEQSGYICTRAMGVSARCTHARAGE